MLQRMQLCGIAAKGDMLKAKTDYKYYLAIGRRPVVALSVENEQMDRPPRIAAHARA